jgi:hypothetical protein
MLRGGHIQERESKRRKLRRWNMVDIFPIQEWI